jgi:hypothetical protein
MAWHSLLGGLKEDAFRGAIDLKKKIFSRWIDEQPHIGDIPTNEVPISLVEESLDVLRAFYHVSCVS